MPNTLKRGISKFEFDIIFNNGVRSSGKFCRVLVSAGKGRYGVATSKSIGCHAKRNRLKRRIQESVRIGMVKPLENLDFVLIGRQDAQNASLQDLADDIFQTLETTRQIWEKKSESS